MSENYFMSRVYGYEGYRMCVAGNPYNYRYFIACPNGTTILRGGFIKCLEASSAAHREAILLSLNPAKQKPG